MYMAKFWREHWELENLTKIFHEKIKKSQNFIFHRNQQISPLALPNSALSSASSHATSNSQQKRSYGVFFTKKCIFARFCPQKGRVWSTKGVNLKKCQKNYLIFSPIPGCMQKFSNFQGANFEIVSQYVTFRYIALFPNPYPMENTARRRGPPLARKKCGTKFSTT